MFQLLLPTKMTLSPYQLLKVWPSVCPATDSCSDWDFQGGGVWWFFDDFVGSRGGHASVRLDHGLKFQFSAALGADLLVNSRTPLDHGVNSWLSEPALPVAKLNYDISSMCLWWTASQLGFTSTTILRKNKKEIQFPFPCRFLTWFFRPCGGRVWRPLCQ